MPGLKFLADMNISPITVLGLQREGWEIIRVSDVMDPKTSDIANLKFARENRMVLITQDLDFSSLLALRGCSGPSIVNLRLNEPTPDAVEKRLLQVLPVMEKTLVSGAVASVDETAVRIRNLPIRFD